MLFRQAETVKAEQPKPKPAALVDLKPSGHRVCYRWPIGPAINADAPFMPSPLPSGKAIIQKFCADHQVGLLDILSRRRSERLVLLRHELAFILKEVTGKSLPEIGKLLNRDHTSILHAIRTHVARTNGSVPQWKDSGRKHSEQTIGLIVRQREAGWTFPAIANFHGLTLGSVKGIVDRAKAKS